MTAQELKQTVANVQRSATQRPSAIARQVRSVRTNPENLASEIEAQRAEWGEAIEARKQEFDETIEARVSDLRAQLDDVRSLLETEKQGIAGPATEQSEQFRQAQDARAEEFKTRAEGYEERISKLESELKRQVADLVTEIEQMKERSAQLVGAIGVTGTAERYGKEADEQRRIADRLRIAAVLIGLVAIAVAVWATHEPEPGALTGKLVISVVLGGAASYLVSQSARHRGREERARGLQLDLTAFPVFTEDLPDPQHVEEKIAMVRRSFLGAQPLPDHGDEPRPSAASQLMPWRAGRDTAGDGQ